MTDRLRDFDWAATPLGPRARWPRALQIAVGICMSSRFPMFVWWGPQLINIYNDAYVPILGEKHPEAFGRPARPTWSEIWDVIGPQADQVVGEGRATWNERVLLVMQRHGYAEDTWFTWSYSPIVDEEGRVAGLFCACYEETGRVAAERERDLLLVQAERERARLDEAFAHSPAFLAILNGPGHVFEYVNAKYVQLLGGRPLVGLSVREAVPEVAGQGIFELLDRVYETGEPFVGTGVRLMLERGAGGALAEAFLDFVYQPLRGAEGRPTGILVHGIDVTDRHRAEARDRFLLDLEDVLRPLSDPRAVVHESARMLCRHLGADRVAYADVEADGDHFEVDGEWSHGLPSAAGRYRFSDFGPDVPRDMQLGLALVIDDVHDHPQAATHAAAYESLQIRAMVGVPLLKAGRVVAGMAAHQATPRRWTRAEVELLEHAASRCYESIARARVERTLVESERRFRDLADSMPQIVFSATPDGRVDYFNRKWYEYTGLAEGDVDFEAWRRVHTPEGLERVLAAWPEAVRTGAPYEIEYPLRRRDGVLRWHLGRAVPVRDDAGRIVRWYGTNTDIDDRKQIEDALSRALHAEQGARREAELASRMKDEFLATLSHELRTPLNAILGWSHILRREEAPRAEALRAAEVIERNARAQARIIDDLLDMSAIISGKVRLEVAELDLATLVRSSIDTARPTAEAKGIAMHERIEPSADGLVHGDAHRLQQVLWNLLTNALRFTAPGGSITVGLREAAGGIEIEVADTGQGIAPEFLPHVFDRFRQADASTTRRHGGLGLGLAIVKQLVELHGGAARAASPGLGAGAAFTVVLPLRPPLAQLPGRRAGEAGEAAPWSEATDRECERLAGKRVLVVDDEPDARDLMKGLLERCQARVTVAGSSEEALALARAQRFDVLVSDIAMPGEDGYSLMRRIRALEADRNADIPAVALTAYARPEDRLRALRAGFQLHAAKPVQPAELIAMIATLAARSAL